MGEEAARNCTEGQEGKRLERATSLVRQSHPHSTEGVGFRE